MGHMMTVATDIADISTNLTAGVVAWGAGAIGLAIAAAAVAWVKQMLD